MTADPARADVTTHLQLRSFAADLVLPAGTEILKTPDPEPLADVRAAVLAALADPIGSAPLAAICAGVLARPASGGTPHPSAVVVVSDNTRTVPYKGDGGILWPLMESLLAAGFPPVAPGSSVCGESMPTWAVGAAPARRQFLAQR